jgi:hypothetical protein
MRRPTDSSVRNTSGVPGSGSAWRNSNMVRAKSAAGTPRVAAGQSMMLVPSPVTTALPG